MDTVGVLALQGAFIEHEKILASLGVKAIELRQRQDLAKSFDRLIIPGGESTVIGKLLNDSDMKNPIKEFIDNGMPVFGTCAGLILLAKEITNDTARHLCTMDITANRNAYGRQLGSFYTESNFNGKNIPMSFIRAPYIEDAGEKVEILSVVNNRIVAAREKNQLVTAFHPELNEDTYVHEYFLSIT